VQISIFYVFSQTLLLLWAFFHHDSQGVDSDHASSRRGCSPKTHARNTPRLDSLNTQVQIRGRCTATLSTNHTSGNGLGTGFAKAVPPPVTGAGLHLVAMPNNHCAFDSSILGHRLFLINQTRRCATLETQDGRLYIVAEARKPNGVWAPIWYLPSSWCGNSYYSIELSSKGWWCFSVPVYTGTMYTQIRYVLWLDGLNTSEKPIYSNVFNARINREQWNPERQEGYSKLDAMAPPRLYKFRGEVGTPW